MNLTAAVARHARILVVALLLAITITASARANQLLNGSFETPVIAPASFTNVSPGGEPAGFAWTVTVNNVDIVSQGVAGWPAPAFDGTQFLDLVGFNSTGGIRQTFTTTVGNQYTLSFEYGNNPRFSPATALVTITSGINTLLSQPIIHSTSTTSDYDWTAFSMNFTATGTSAVLDFLETSGGNNGGIFLDAVSVDRFFAAVPEPASLAVFVTALLGFAPLRRRRKGT